MPLGYQALLFRSTLAVKSQELLITSHSSIRIVMYNLKTTSSSLQFYTLTETMQ